MAVEDWLELTQLVALHLEAVKGVHRVQAVQVVATGPQERSTREGAAAVQVLIIQEVAAAAAAVGMAVAVVMVSLVNKPQIAE